MTRPRTRPPPLLLWRGGLGERRGGGGGIMVGEAWVRRVRRQDEDVDEAPHGGRLRRRERGKRRPASRLPLSRSRTWAGTQRRTPPLTTRRVADASTDSLASLALRLCSCGVGALVDAVAEAAALWSTSEEVAVERSLHGGDTRWWEAHHARHRREGRGTSEEQEEEGRQPSAGPCDRVIDKLREGEVVVWRRGWLVGGETVVARVAEDDLDSSKQNFRMQLPGIKHTFYTWYVPLALLFLQYSALKETKIYGTLFKLLCLADAFSELSRTDGQTLVRDLQERKGKTL
uniref:Uncharacterized protein n=1 Tax=Oryza meridionalis TaxID=40149 RepID=A0A0E0C4V3_9ORYZ